MEDYIEIPIKSFKNGWMPSNPDSVLGGIESFIDCNNVRLQYGEISKIRGWRLTAIGQLAGDVRKFITFNKGDATEKLVAITQHRFYEIIFPVSAIDRTDAVFPFNTERVAAIQFGDLLIFTNNCPFVPVKKWTGTGNIANLGGLDAIGLTLAKTLESNNEFVILGNVVIADVRRNKTVVWCDRQSPEVWSPLITNEAGDLDFAETAGEILRIKKLAELNIVYKEDDIEFLISVGLPFTYVRKFYTASIGLLGHDAVEEVNNVHYLVGSDFDIYRFDAINLVSLGGRNGIRDYIRTNINMAKHKETRVEYDPDYKEMRFIFPRKSPKTVIDQRFEIVFNIEEQRFTKRDSIATAAGHYREPISSDVADTFAGLIAQNAGSIPANLFGQHGIPRYQEIIGDKDGYVYYYDDGDTMNTYDYEGYIETGDEDFQFLRRINIGRKIKQVSEIAYLGDNNGAFFDVNVKIGVRNALNKNIVYKGPFAFKQNPESSGKINPRVAGVYHRYRFYTEKGNQYFNLGGFILRLEIVGEGRT